MSDVERRTQSGAHAYSGDLAHDVRQMETIVGRGADGSMRTRTGPARLYIRSLFPLGDDLALIAGSLVDPESRVRAIRLGRGQTLDLATLAVRSGAAGAGAPATAGFGFLGIFKSGVDAAGLAFETHLSDGGMSADWAPACESLEPFQEFIASNDVEDALALAERLIACVRDAPNPRNVPHIDTLLDWVAQRIEGDRNAHVADRGANAYVDRVERIEGEGVVIGGWLVHGEDDPPVSCAAVSFSGLRAEIALPLPAIRRPDVVEAVYSQIPSARVDCGFVAYAPTKAIGPLDSRWRLETRLRSGKVVRASFRLPAARRERAAIETLIEWAEPQAVDLSDLFARTLDAPLAVLWARAGARRAEPKSTAFGALPRPPKVSVIVPLFGRLDLLRHQLAQFSNDPDFAGDDAVVELIYVLDDPRAGSDFHTQARLASDLYRVPFRLVDLAGNYGYSRANNAGAAFATGPVLILLNSDVIPKGPGWATRLADTLDATPNCGVLGCRLLYEDGSLQHAGMAFREAAMLPGAFVNEHPAKGFSVAFDPHSKLEAVPSVTGACLTISRDLYQAVGGLEESYILGDFEDSDLCLKVRARGLDVCYTPDVEHYHLERLSMRLIAEGRPAWRQRLTLFNMWRHARMWREAIAPLTAR